MNKNIFDKMIELVKEFEKKQLKGMSTIVHEVDGGDNTINGESYLIYIEWDDKNKENDEENIIHLVNGVKKTKSKVLNIIQNLANKVFKETKCKNFTISYKINGCKYF